jgi:P27 family predicted phage terminase small subunit
MAPVAAGVWCTIVADMSALRTLREVDLPLVRAYCEAAQVHADASDLVSRKGVLVGGRNGPMPNPMIKVAKDAAVTMRQLSDVLGLNPLARIRGNLMEAATGSMVLDIQKRLREFMAE